MLNIYPKLILVVSFMALGFSSAFGQLNLKLQLIDENTWGVYVKPIGVTPSMSTITGSAQVTVVMPKDYTYLNLQSVNGSWDPNAIVNGPVENPGRKYVSFGLITDNPKIIYKENEETLLFTFDRPGGCPDTLYLIDCNTAGVSDPFCPDYPDGTPGDNSYHSNPGNEFSVIDFGHVPPVYYSYAGNYAPSAWSCQDCDHDGILNAFEDTNGNGEFDEGIDSSALCDPCDPIHPESATMSFLGLDGIICAGDLGDTAFLVIDIVGGWTPYVITYSDGTTTYTVSNFRSGDSIAVVPAASTTYQILSVVDSFGCDNIDPDSISAGVQIIVEGPLSITDNPDNVTQCSGFGTSFTITASNAGAGTISYQWQVSTNNGTTWTNLANGTPYSHVNTDSLVISNVAGLHGRCYRAAISTPHCDTIYSGMACLSVEGPVKISVGGSPSNVTLCDGGTATFTGSGVNEGAVGTLYYQWQENTGSGWTDLANSGVYSGVTTGTVTIHPASVGMDSSLYRLKIFTGTCSDTVFTTAAMLNIEGPVTITNDPDHVSNCAGNEVFFVSEFSNPGGGTTFAQWQIADSESGPWSNISNASGVYTGVTSTNVTSTGSDTLTITNVMGLDGKWYRVLYTTPACTTPQISGAAQLTVMGNVSFSDHPDDITVCSGNDTLFVAAASIPEGTFLWGWQYSDNGGTSWTNISLSGGVFSHTASGPVNSGTDTLKISNVGSMYNFRFRAVAISPLCDSVFSNQARLSIEGPLSVTSHPAGDNVLCSGQGTLFSAEIANPGIPGSTIYRWQFSKDGGSSWTDLSNSTPYNGTGTDAMSISNSMGLHGYCYRLSARTSTCNVIYTNEICLTVEGPVEVKKQPTDIVLCSGSSASFTSTANTGPTGTLSYKWQISTDNGDSWADLTNTAPFSGVNDTTLTISNVEGLYNTCYRLGFYTGECDTLFSNKACLTVEGPISILDQPDDVTQCSGQPVNFIVGADNNPLGGIIQYQWQESTDNGTTWNDLVNAFPYNGVKSDTLSISNTKNKDNNLYRVLIWTGKCDTLASDVALLSIEGPIIFTADPDNVTQCSGSGVQFQANYNYLEIGIVSLQWQRSCDNGLNWVNIADGGVYSGATTTSLNISDIAGLDNCRFRLAAWTPTCDTVKTNYALLKVEGPLSFLEQPKDTVRCSNSGISFSVVVDTSAKGQLSYQWQVSVDNGLNWSNLSNNSQYNGVKSATLSISNVSGLNGRCYRVNVQTATCAAITSDVACLTVEGPISFTTHPVNITQCSNEGVKFFGAAAIQAGNAGTIVYQWQTSDDGLNWIDVADGTPAGYSGSATDTLTVANVAGLNGRRYRLTARTSECNRVNSNPATITVEGPLSIESQPVSLATCDDKEVIFGAAFLNGGVGLINYQWQQNSGSGWVDLANGTFGPNIINGTKTDSLSISPVTGLNGTQYRLLGWSGSCDTLITNVVTLSVEGPLEFDNHPEDVTLCSNSSTWFDVDVTNVNGIGSIQYQWETSVNGIIWSEISNGGVYSGATSDSLVISNITGLGNHKFRCKVKTGTCDWEYSQLATLFVEGPITISQQPLDAVVCSNIGHIFNTTVVNPGSGTMSFQWQVKPKNDTWANVDNGPTGANTGKYQGAKTMDLSISLVENMDDYAYRLIINTSTCADTTNEVLLTVMDACLTGTCDNDLDGIINDLDDDDDNDLLADEWEEWMTLNNTIEATTKFPNTGPWNYQDANLQLISYNRCIADSDGNGIIDGLEDPDGDNLTNHEETNADGIFDGNPLDPCNPVLGPTCIGINLAIKMYLQGALVGPLTVDSLMNDKLRSYGPGNTRLIPLEEPYSGIMNGSVKPFKHKGDGGGETVTDSTIFHTVGPDAIVDWVFVEIRSSVVIDSVITTRAALLQRDGDVVDLDGNSSLHFDNAPAGPYYVAVRHRNHLGVMTAEAFDLSPTIAEIDFTDTTFLTNGTNAQVKLKLKDKYVNALWAGDLNSDGRTIYQGPANDILYLFQSVLGEPDNTTHIANYITEGYRRSDFDLNGLSIYQGPNNDRSLLLFNTTLVFPENKPDPDIPGSSPLANYIIFQQLP